MRVAHGASQNPINDEKHFSGIAVDRFKQSPAL
jgi:hypothetical protein